MITSFLQVEITVRVSSPESDLLKFLNKQDHCWWLAAQSLFQDAKFKQILKLESVVVEGGGNYIIIVQFQK